MAFLSVLTLNVLDDIPQHALPQFWPRCWSWIRFLNRYHTCIPARDSGSAHDNRTAYVFLLEQFYRDMETAAIVDATPGVRILVGEHWRSAVALPHHAGIGPVCTFIHGREMLDKYFRDPPAETALDLSLVDELIEGAGGGIEDLAKLVADHIRLVSSNTEDWLPTLHSVSLFIEPFRGDAHWKSALKSAGLAEALIGAIHVIIASESDYISPYDLAELCLDTATRLTAGNLKHFTATLKAGLLDAIVACAREGYDVPTAQALVERRLPDLTIYRSVLRCMRNVSGDSVPETSSLSAGWRAFTALAEERITLMKWFDSDGYRSSRACDNVECGVILVKTAFRRCAGCLRHYYCSEACQRADWRVGGHREACENKCLCFRCTIPMHTRDRDFFRALLHQDYLALKPEILAAQAEFIAARPDEPFYVGFDYTGGHATAAVHPFTRETYSLWSTGDERCDEQLRARAECSCGRLVMHRVFISMGDMADLRWFPLRTMGGAPGNGLVEIH
ncbi:hypothetical protein B0H14DRAFT_2848759 [Mycena olivaceomarginata]|nr:hypothetical protein B0H14DRAFT_2848759 [Mycena olivaceomarginata]